MGTASEIASVNEVVLVGRISGYEERILPSGDCAAVFRVVVDRPPNDRGPSGRVAVDALDCVVWRASARRRLSSMPEGEWVRVQGSLRRRFWKAAGQPASRSEVEVREVRRVRP